MNFILFIPLFIGIIITALMLPSWIKRAKKAKLVGKDMNKYSKPEIAESGGVIVVVGFLIGVLSYMALKTFYFKSSADLIEIFALIISITIISFVGMIDDILGWKIGLGKRTRIFLVFMGAIPLIVINAGQSYIGLPFLNTINLGLIFPLIIIPLGIIGTTTTFNFLAGYNGLETGQGIIIIGFLSFVSYATGSPWLAIIGLCMVAALLVFYFYNKYPAKVFPGDVITYPLGALIAIMAILGDFEKIAVFIFIPYILEVGLKIRGKLKRESFGKPNEDGSLEMPHKNIYGLAHLAIFILGKFNKKVYERDVVYSIFILQIIIILISMIIFKGALFA